MDEVKADRWQIGGGWFLIPGILAKAEYVSHKFTGYPTSHIRNGGKFHEVVTDLTIITYELTAAPAFSVPDFLLTRLLKTRRSADDRSAARRDCITQCCCDSLR